MLGRITSGSRPQTLRRRQVITTGALAIIGIAARPAPVSAQNTGEISHSEEAIHQERSFTAPRARIYSALTVAALFDRMLQRGGVMPMAGKSQQPATLSPQVGATFALFGGHIVGRQLELVADELIVQAWRVVNWPRGMYSIARFELSDQGGGTKLVFDHTGFPKGDAEHLAAGWQEHYWEPLTKL
jgi:activator of HSP90 ATPase